MQHDKGSLRFTKEMPATPLRLGHAIHVTWPVLSAILAVQLALGLLTGFVEGAVYFTFVTGLTIGYGDLVPKQTLARALSRC